jgi:hypothetical protein
MKHAVKYIHFVGIGLVGGGAPTTCSAAAPLPPGTVGVRR